MPKSYWPNVVFTACYLIKRLPNKVLNGLSPIQFYSKFHPISDISLKIFDLFAMCTIMIQIKISFLIGLLNVFFLCGNLHLKKDVSVSIQLQKEICQWI